MCGCVFSHDPSNVIGAICPMCHSFVPFSATIPLEEIRSLEAFAASHQVPAPASAPESMPAPDPASYQAAAPGMTGIDLSTVPQNDLCFTHQDQAPSPAMSQGQGFSYASQAPASDVPEIPQDPTYDLAQYDSYIIQDMQYWGPASTSYSPYVAGQAATPPTYQVPIQPAQSSQPEPVPASYIGASPSAVAPASASYPADPSVVAPTPAVMPVTTSVLSVPPVSSIAPDPAYQTRQPHIAQSQAQPPRSNQPRSSSPRASYKPSNPWKVMASLLIAVIAVIFSVRLFQEFITPTIANAYPTQISIAGCICSEQGHENALTADADGKCPAAFHILQRTGDGSEPAYIPTPKETIWDVLDEKQAAKVARIEEQKRIAAEQEAARIAAEQAAASAILDPSVTAPSVPSGSTSSSGSSATSPSPAPAASLSPMQISALGCTVSYIDSYGWASAPKRGAGLWWGSDSVTDGDLGFFIGHHPGDFNFVMDIRVGDTVTVKDRYGNQRTYNAKKVFNYPQNGYLEYVLDDLGSWGESVLLQTCLGDGGKTVRFVYAE